MTGKEEIIFDENSIRVSMNRGRIIEYIMHSAETSLMHKLSDLVTRKGGNILEIGFGMGICSNRIQQNKNVISHTIIEVHPEIYKTALKWAENKKNVRVLLGDWIDIIPTIQDTKFDGVLHDTFSDPNIGKLINLVKPICQKDCVIAFFINYENKDLKVLKHEFSEEEVLELPYKLPLTNLTNEYRLRYTIVD